MQSEITAAILVIGEEVLSGRTKDKNISFIAEKLVEKGIILREVRIIGDIEDDIIGAIIALSLKYTYIFTTGGIGPTHDDITADSIAKAFNAQLEYNEEALKMMLGRYSEIEMNEARLRMTRIPQGASLIPNAISQAPGFWLKNIIVMAGVPAIMQNMFEWVLPHLSEGDKFNSFTIDSNGLPEGIYSIKLGEIAKKYPDVSIGSYPSIGNGKYKNEIVLRSRDKIILEKVASEVRDMLSNLKADGAQL